MTIHTSATRSYILSPYHTYTTPTWPLTYLRQVTKVYR